MKSKLLLVFLLALTIGAQAQVPEQISEAEVNLQKLFIEASRQKLLEKYDEALVIYKRILEEDADNDAVAFEMGRIYHLQKNIEEAVKSLRQAIELDPENEWYYRYLSDIFQQTNQNEKGASLYENMVKRWPDNEHFYLKWAYFLVRDREVNKAIKVYEQLENRIGINDEVSRRKHLLYLGAGENKKAARELERLIDAFPREVSYRHMLAAFYENVKNEAAAKAVYEDIIRIDPQDTRAKLALAGQSGGKTDDLQYLARLESLFEQESIDLDEKMKMLIPFIQQVADKGDPQLGNSVLELIDILQETHPAEAKIFAAKGDILSHTGYLQSGARAYQEALANDESVYAVWEQLMQLQYQLGRSGELLKTADEVTLIFPNRARTYYLLGAAALQEDDTDEARYALDQALLMSARDAALQAEVRAVLANVLWQEDKPDAARQMMDQARQSGNLSPELGYWTAYLAYRSGDKTAATQTLQKVLQADARHSRALELLSRISYEAKAYADTRKQLEPALTALSEPAADLVERYGDALYQLGETEAALSQWNRAKELGADHENLQKKIADRRLYE